eukprot:2288651-Rhodomonas_salina.1
MFTCMAAESRYVIPDINHPHVSTAHHMHTSQAFARGCLTGRLEVGDADKRVDSVLNADSACFQTASARQHQKRNRLAPRPRSAPTSQHAGVVAQLVLVAVDCRAVLQESKEVNKTGARNRRPER